MTKSIILAICLVAAINAAVLPFDNSAVEKIFQNKKAALFLFTNDNTESQAAQEAFNGLDATNPEDVILTLSDKNDGHGLFDRLAEYLGVKTNNVPAVLYLGSANDKYLYDQEEITAENLASFLERVKAGSVEQFLKSAEIPESNDEPVKIIVGKTFNDIVLNNDKEVLVKFYAPWCGHCKTLAPHFDEAAKRLLSNPNIVIAKVDSTENEVANVDIQGFPTLKFWGKDKSQPPIDFNGERSAEGIIQWLKDHTSYEWVDETEASAEL